MFATKGPYPRALSDGSYLANIYASTDRSHREGLLVRVIEYTVNGAQQTEPYRLITNILDPQTAPAEELAALYRERWEFENMLDELKTHLNDNATTLRSRTPDLVIQEIYGLVMAHYAVRAIMYEAAYSAQLDPDELSFVHSIRVLRRKLPTFGSFPPSPVGAPNPI
jgi:IS4 transposase